MMVIIGGGLAGLTLSIQLAKKGMEVSLIEMKKYPFHKVCGEYIAMESWEYLIDCGIPLDKMSLPRIDQLKITSPNGNQIEHILNPGGFGISRYTLDELLAAEAKKVGVKFYENTKVISVEFVDEQFKVETENEILIADIVIGAFGKRSNLDLKLNRTFIKKSATPKNNYVGVKYHIKTNLLPSNRIELHNFKDGYCGISKVDNETYCLCYLTTASQLQKYGSIAEMEKNVVMKNPYLHRYFNESEFLYDAPLSISQVNFSNKTVVEDHILMCGDSAGLIAPLCGNGMSMAMHSSKIASELIPKFVNGHINRMQLELSYKSAWEDNFKLRINVGRIIQYSFGREFLTNAVITGLKPFPRIISSLIRLTHGKSF